MLRADAEWDRNSSRAHFTRDRNGTEMGPKWDRHGTDIFSEGPKWDRNGTEMGPTWKYMGRMWLFGTVCRCQHRTQFAGVFLH